MKKITSLLVSLIMIVCLCSCGGNGGKRADEALYGNYVASSATAMGITLTGDDIPQMSFELKEKGKGTVVIDGKDYGVKWTNDDTSVTLSIDGTDCPGTISGNDLVFADMLSMGVDITFTKE